jgi:hypothetical protein
MNMQLWELFMDYLRLTKRKPKERTKGVSKMRYRLNLDNYMLFVDIDKEKRTVNRIELEGELPLLVADTRHGSASLWMLTEDLTSEWGFDADMYNHDEIDGETHIWKWLNEKGDVALRVVIYSPKHYNNQVGQVVVAVGESGDTSRTLLNFMTDFEGWTLIETYGEIEASLREYGLKLTNKKESELHGVSK